MAPVLTSLSALSSSVLSSVSSSMMRLPVEKIDPGVKANSSGPWLPTVRDLVGMGMTTGVVIVVGVLVVGVVLAVAGKLGQMHQSSSVGYKILFWGLIAGAAIGSASALIFWATGLKLA